VQLPSLPETNRLGFRCRRLLSEGFCNDQWRCKGLAEICRIWTHTDKSLLPRMRFKFILVSGNAPRPFWCIGRLHGIAIARAEQSDLDIRKTRLGVFSRRMAEFRIWDTRTEIGHGSTMTSPPMNGRTCQGTALRLSWRSVSPSAFLHVKVGNDLFRSPMFDRKDVAV
jgi:hypothetical protein